MTDIVSFGSDKPPWRPPRRLIVAGAVALAVVAAGVAAFAVRHDAGSVAVSPSASAGAPARAAPPCPATTSPAGVGSLAGLVIACAAQRGSSLDRRDRTAKVGPWTVVVRRADGSLGRHSAVVTFPVSAPPATTRHVVVGRATGAAAPGMVTWPIAGAYARVRGDLPESALIAIGAHTTVVDKRPAVKPPSGYRVAAVEPYRAPEVHEVRYGTTDLGEQAALGSGLTFTGVARGGGYEDLLYESVTQGGGAVDGRSAVVSSVFGGNGALAWEPTPGVVAYVGYSGASLDDTAVAALRRLAGRSRPLTDAQWRATGPTQADQTNEPG